MAFTPAALKTARDSGYSDTEIADYIGGSDTKYRTAIDSGYSIDEIADFEESQRPAQPMLDILKRIPAGVAKASADAIVGVTKLGEYVNPLQKLPGVKQGIEAATDYVRGLGETSESAYGIDPQFNDKLASQIASGAGSMIPILASGPLAPLTTAGMMGEQSRQEAEEHGGSEMQKELSFATGATVGAISEALLGVPALLRSAKAAGVPERTFKAIVQAAAVQVAKGAPREATQEALEQGAQNVIANTIAGYDKDRDTFHGVKEAALVGAILGGAVGGGVQVATSIDAMKGVAPATAAALEQTVAEKGAITPTFPETQPITNRGDTNEEPSTNAAPTGSELDNAEPVQDAGEVNAGDSTAAEAAGGDTAADLETDPQTGQPTGERQASVETARGEAAPSITTEVAEQPADEAADIQSIVPKITVAGEPVTGKKGQEHKDVLKEHIENNRDKFPKDSDAEFDAIANFDSKQNPNYFTDGKQDISRANLKKDYDVSDSQGLSRKQQAEAKAATAEQPAIEPTAPSVPKSSEQKSIPKGLRINDELSKVLSGEVNPEGTKLKPVGKREEAGAAGGTGGTRATTQLVGTTPSGSRDWIRIPPAFKRLFKGLEREGFADVMAKQKNLIGKLLGKQSKVHVDTEAEILGQESNKMNRAMQGLTRNAADRAFTEVNDFIREKENGRPTPTLSPTAAKLWKAWQDIAESTGDLARAYKVMVKDAAAGGYRLMGNLGRDYVPRMFNAQVENVLRDPERDKPFFNSLAQAIATHRGITIEDAAAELHSVAGRFQANDFMGNIEMARGEQLPEIFYEYDLRNLYARYIPSFSERMSQIIAYGQQLGPRDAPIREDLWDIAKKETQGKDSQVWMREAEDQAKGIRMQSAPGRFAARAGALGNAYLLSDPTGTVIRNMISGGASTAEIFGVTRSLKNVKAAFDAANQNDAKEMGAVRDNISDFINADQLGFDWMDEVIRKFSTAALKYSGFTGSEVVVRTHAALTASQYAKDAATALAGPKINGLAKEALAMFKRWDIDPAKIVAEKGDWKTGEETRKFIRTAIREMQGGYRFDQVPAWANSPVGRFLYQYGRWGVQRSRNLFKNMIQPIIGTDVDWNGKQMTVRNYGAALRSGASIVATGEIFAAIAAALFGRDRKDASLSEIKAGFDESTKKGLALAGDRIINDMIMGGMMGIWGQPVDWIKSASDQSRLKNPAEPPSMAGINTFADMLSRAWRQGELTRRDLMDMSGQVFRGGKNISDVARNVFDEPLYEAENDLRTMRASAKRWAVQQGMDVATKGGKMPKAKKAPIYEPISEALLTGDADKARQLVTDYLATQPDRKTALKAVRSSVLSRQPFRAGPFYSESHKKDFMVWAGKNLSKDDLNQVRRVQDRYMQAAKKADLR